MAGRRKAKGKAGIRKLIRENLPPRVVELYDRMPDPSDEAWCDEFERCEMALYLDATNKALGATDLVEQSRWHAIARQHSEHLRKTMAARLNRDDEGTPSSIDIRVAGLDKVKPEMAPPRKGMEDGKD